MDTIAFHVRLVFVLLTSMLTLFGSGGCARPAKVIDMYAVTWQGEILKTDGLTGETREIGKYAPGRLNSLAVSREGELFTVYSADSRRPDDTQSFLIHIDSLTGEPQAAAILSKPLSVRALTFDYRNRLLAIADDGKPPPNESVSLFEIDASTGDCTPIGPTRLPMLQSLCLDPYGEVLGYNGGLRRTTQKWGLIALDPNDASVRRLTPFQDPRRVPNVQALASHPDGTLYAVAPDNSEDSQPSALFVVNPNSGKLRQIRAFEGWDVRGIEFLPNSSEVSRAASGRQERFRSWSTVVSEEEALLDTSGVTARVRSIEFRATVRPDQSPPENRLLTVEFDVHRGPVEPPPLITTNPELLELRNQRGEDLTKVGKLLSYPRGSGPPRAYALWTEGFELQTEDIGDAVYSNPAHSRRLQNFGTLRISEIPLEQLRKISILRARVYARVATRTKVIELTPDAIGKQIPLCDGYAVMLSSWSDFQQSQAGVVEALIVATDGPQDFDVGQPPAHLWRVTPNWAKPPISRLPSSTNSAITREGVALRITHSWRRPVDDNTPPSIRLEFVTEFETHAIDMEIRDVTF